MIEIPTYIQNSNQENYNELFNLAVRSWLSIDGLALPAVTSAQLTIINALVPPPENGTVWYVSDAVPPAVVIKINGALAKVTTTAYP